MLPSDITKMAQSFSDIAEGKDKDDSYLETDMKKRRKNNEKAVEDMKKVKDDTVPRWMRERFELVVAESYYYKRLKVMSVELAERFLDIAEGCIVMGYESPKLIDNIAEALDKDIVGHDFRAALGTVNPHLNENAQTAGRKQAKAVAMQISEAPQKPGVYGQVGGLEIGTNPGKNQDLGYRAGRALTNMSGDLVKGVGNQLRNIFTGTPNTAATNPAAARNNQRLKNIGGFLQTGQMPGSGASTPAAPAASTPAAPARPQRGQGGRALGSTTQRQGGAVNPTTANAPAPAAPKPAPSAPAKPAPTAATKPFVKQTGNKAADMATWAKANPKLAAAQKIRQSGGSRSEVNKALYNKGTAAATGTPTVVKAGYEYVRSKLIEGIRDKDPEKGTEERKERLEKKRGMKLDDHPQYKKEEVEQIDEMPYQVYGSPDGKKEKKIGKPIKSRKYADARAAELEDTHKKTGGKYRSEYTKEEVTEMSLYDIVVSYLQEEKLAIDEEHAALVIPELSAEEVAYIVDEYTTKHGKKAMDWNRSDDKPKTVAKNPKMPKKKEGKCSCCGNDPCTCS
jgi:hypothetical protein